MCKPPRKLTSVSSEPIWNEISQDVYKKARHLIKNDVCHNMYDTKTVLCIETDAPSIGLGTGLLQTHDGTVAHFAEVPGHYVLRPIAFASKCYLWFPKVTLHLSMHDSLLVVVSVTIAVIIWSHPWICTCRMCRIFAFSPIRSFPMLYQWDSSGKNILHFLSFLCVFEWG